MMSANLIDIDILKSCGNDYHCIINGICESEAVDLLQNADLSEKKLIIKKSFFFIVCKRWIKKL